MEPLDLLTARNPAQPRVYEGDLDWAAADCFERIIPCGSTRHEKLRRDRHPEFLELQIGNRCQYQHFPRCPPQEFPNCRKNALRCRKNALNATAHDAHVGSDAHHLPRTVEVFYDPPPALCSSPAARVVRPYRGGLRRCVGAERRNVRQQQSGDVPVDLLSSPLTPERRERG